MRSLAMRALSGVTIGIAAYLLFQLIRVVADASGLCTGCNAADQGDVLGAASLGGAAASLGGGGDPEGNRLDRWLDRLLGPGRPPPTVESVDPPAPPDPVQQQIDAQDTERARDYFKRLLLTKSGVEMPEGSLGAEWIEAVDRFFDFASDNSDIGPSPPDDGDPP